MARNTSAIWILLSVPLLLCACSLTPMSAPIPTAELKMCIKVTCTITAKVVAWIDVDADGVQDRDETSLPGVRFQWAGDPYSSATSDERGVALVFFHTAGEPVPCESIDDSCRLATQRVIAEGRSVEPEMPSGYRLTTPLGIRRQAGSPGSVLRPLPRRQPRLHNADSGEPEQEECRHRYP